MSLTESADAGPLPGQCRRLGGRRHTSRDGRRRRWYRAGTS